MQVTMEQRIYNVKLYFRKNRLKSSLTKFRILFPEHLPPPPNKTK